VEWATVEDMEREVRESVENGLLICYGSCCHELQTREQHRQHALVQKLERYLEQGIQAQNERQANAAFIYLNVAATLLHNLQLWLLLKSDRMNEAWDQLVEAQDSLRSALRFVQDDALRHWYMELLAAEKLLFPPQRF
jgi:threonine aldolase